MTSNRINGFLILLGIELKLSIMSTSEQVGFFFQGEMRRDAGRCCQMLISDLTLNSTLLASCFQNGKTFRTHNFVFIEITASKLYK